MPHTQQQENSLGVLKVSFLRTIVSAGENGLNMSIKQQEGDSSGVHDIHDVKIRETNSKRRISARMATREQVKIPHTTQTEAVAA